MSEHDSRQIRPSGYEIAYECACGWTSDAVPSGEGYRAGAQILRHLSAAILGEDQP